jgi:hypothetical protein
MLIFKNSTNNLLPYIYGSLATTGNMNNLNTGYLIILRNVLDVMLVSGFVFKKSFLLEIHI